MPVNPPLNEGPDRSPRPPAVRTWKLVASVAGAVLLAASLVGVVIHFDAQGRVVVLLDWIDELGIWGPVLLIVLDLLVVILLLPGVMFTLGAGFLFGLWWGTLFIVIGTAGGAILAFLIARHLFSQRFARYLMEQPNARVLEGALVQSGWKFILLTRLIPFFPFKLTNYLFGLGRFRLRDFVIGTVIGIIPYTLTNVYVGSLAADLATLGVRGEPRQWWEWALYAGMLLLAVAMLVFITRRARRILAREMGRQDIV
jgi:uncharacterized membrane protein YdjX (TVP38/TMEM64 family)